MNEKVNTFDTNKGGENGILNEPWTMQYIWSNRMEQEYESLLCNNSIPTSLRSESDVATQEVLLDS